MIRHATAVLAFALLAGAVLPHGSALGAHLFPAVTATVPVFAFPLGLAVDPVANRTYVTGGQCCSLGLVGRVAVIDGATNGVLATISVAGGAVYDAVNPATGRLYVTHGNGGPNIVTVIDTATNSVVTTIPVGVGPFGVAVNPATNRIYVANNRSHTVSVIDGGTNAVVTTIPLAGPLSVTIDPTTDRVYVTTAGTNVAVIDGGTNTLLTTIADRSDTGAFGIGINTITKRVYVPRLAGAAGGTVAVMDVIANTVIASIPVGAQPNGVGVNPATDRGYVASRALNRVAVIDLAANAVVTTLGVGSTPFDVAANPVTDRVYVSNTFGASVSVIGNGAATLTLDPPAAVNPVGELHCVTATTQDATGNPTPGITVRFTVIGAQSTSSSPPTGSDTTDSAGQAEFCFTAALPGDNVIHAFADNNRDGDQDVGSDPSGNANKTWTLPPSTELCEVRVTEGGRITAVNGDTATFSGVAMSDAAGNASGNQRYRDHGPVQPMTVESTEILAVTCTSDKTTATIFGNAAIDGAGSFSFRIRVSDNGPGATDVYGILLSNGYASGDRMLEGGNVEIR